MNTESMEYELIYSITKDEATVIGCKGYVSQLILPSEVEGKPVTAIGEQAFRDCTSLNRIKMPGSIKRIENYAFSGCREIREICLGVGVTYIGDHTFYNCRGLSKMTLPGGITHMGDGALKNCMALEHVTIIVGIESMTTMKNIIADLSGDVEITIEYRNHEKASVFFPKDSMYLSDFSTRLYMDVTYGIGSFYRQCVYTDYVDYEKYDVLLSRAQNELSREAVARIAMLRLQYPYQLREHHKKQYEAYIKEHSLSIVKEGIESEQLEQLNFILQENYITEDKLNQAIEIAQEENKVECAGILLNYKHIHYSKIDTSFDL